MKKTLFRTLIAVLALSSTVLTTSCKNNDPDEPEPIEINAENPRYITEADGNIYVTCYNPMSVIRFDLSQRTITGICNLGQFHPEGIAAVNGKLYIASSNISDANGNYSYDNKLYIVNIETFKLVDSVTVSYNPSLVKKLDNNHIVFNTLGNYSSDFGGTYIMNTTTKEIVDLNQCLTNFSVYNGDIYGYQTVYNPDYSSTDHFYKIDGSSHQVSELSITLGGADGAYGIFVSPVNGNIVVTTNGNYIAAGDCYVFNNDGSIRMNAVQMGNLPSRAAAIDGDNLIVLNEGGWVANNAGVSRVDVANSTAIVNFFSDNNGRGLGDVAQDMLVKNGKAYITVTFSNSIEIMDVTTGKSTRYATSK